MNVRQHRTCYRRYFNDGGGNRINATGKRTGRRAHRYRDEQTILYPGDMLPAPYMLTAKWKTAEQGYVPISRMLWFFLANLALKIIFCFVEFGLCYINELADWRWHYLDDIPLPTTLRNRYPTFSSNFDNVEVPTSLLIIVMSLGFGNAIFASSRLWTRAPYWWRRRCGCSYVFPQFEKRKKTWSLAARSHVVW